MSCILLCVSSQVPHPFLINTFVSRITMLVQSGPLSRLDERNCLARLTAGLVSLYAKGAIQPWLAGARGIC